MKKLVKDFMTNQNVVVANTDHKFSQLMQFFAQFPVHHIPVIENNKVVGIISAKDVIRHFYNHLVKYDFQADMTALDIAHPLESVMTKNPVTVKPEATMEDVVKIFKANHFHSLPVVDENGVCGILTTKDIAKQALK